MSVKKAKRPEPFLKWAGGKRLLLHRLLPYAQNGFERYFEPFLGGGAMFFALQPQRAWLSDVNPELVNTYEQVRDNVESVIEGLQGLEVSPTQFYTIRKKLYVDPTDRAIRFLYLNRTAFNGLYRVNLKGEFNVPFGCKAGTVLCDAGALRAASEALRNAKLGTHDFSAAFRKVRDGDLVYCDPPYTVKHSNNGFRKYNEAIFSWADQERLARSAHGLAKRGAMVIVSNAYHADLLALYPTFTAIPVSRPSVISGKAAARGLFNEYIFVSPNCRIDMTSAHS